MMMFEYKMQNHPLILLTICVSLTFNFFLFVFLSSLLKQRHIFVSQNHKRILLFNLEDHIL